MKLRSLLFLLVAAASFLSLKLPSLGFAELENDELIYLSVAANLERHGRYSLQGTAVLPRLSPAVYDHPFFHHPPLGVWLMIPLVSPALPVRGAVLVSWLGHLLLLVGIWLWLRALVPHARPWVVAAVLLLAIADPIAVFTGQRIWLDALLGGWTALGSGLYLAATRATSRGRETALLAASGAALGLGALTKLPALLIVPALLVPWLWQGRSTPRSTGLRHLLWVGAPLALCVVPWFVKFHSIYGTLMPGWSRPDAFSFEHFPFLRETASRPPYYFFTQTLVVYPWLAVSLCTGVAALRRRDGAWAVAWAFLLWSLACVTALAVSSGHTYQMRYLTMSVAPLYALCALTLHDLSRWSAAAHAFLALAALSGAGCAVAHVVAHDRFHLRGLLQLLL
jgi:4-amino-4-deoxy-L-arabinose transferase-like glycosyltransferase